MNYSNLRSQILAAIKYPPKISAASLQEQLINIVNGLDLGALLLGVATPSLTPNTEANGFYFALQSGTYTNFPTINGQTITVDSSEVAIIVRSGNYWSKIHITTYPTIDPKTKHWMIGNEDTGVLAEGTTPHIDQESGNWMIGTYDTGIHAQGAPGKDAYQPFKGSFSSVQDLNAAYPEPNDGDTAYVEDTVDNTTVLKVYDVVNGEWHDTGTTADSPMFGSGQFLSSVKIDDTNLDNPPEESLPKAKDVAPLKSMLVEKVSRPFTTYNVDDISQYKNYGVTAEGSWSTNSAQKHIEIEAAGINFVKIAANLVAGTKLAFLTQRGSATPGGSVALVEGTAPIYIPIGKTIVLEIPNGTIVISINLGRDDQNYVQKPSYVGLAKEYVEDSLESNDINRPLSANQGRILNGLILDVNKRTFVYENLEADQSNKKKGAYISPVSGLWKTGTESGATCWFIQVSKDDIIFIKANEDYNSYFAFVATTDINIDSEPDYVVQEQGLLSLSVNDSGYYTAPDDCYLYVTIRQNVASRVFKPALIQQAISLTTWIGKVQNAEIKAIKPLLIYETISKSSNDFSPSKALLKKMIATPRFIKVPSGGNFEIKPINLSCIIRVFEYAGDFTSLGNTDYQIDAGTEESLFIQVKTNTSYVKIALMSDADYTYDMPLVELSLNGGFSEDWDTYNPRPTDDGYHRIVVYPNVTNPTCCDDEGDNAQDTENLLTDFGVICLPTTYTNTGNPTRLIIYCHGGAVNYTSSTVRFDSIDLEPDYWLAEGYAIMDVEGNPFNDNDEHFQIPQAMDCYVAAYKWAVEHYNLRRDGVFLGGRSMGGGMTFNLLKGQCPIPVIAACPNAAHGMCIGGTTPAGTTGSRQRFYAEHCGFEIPSGFDWSSSYYNGDTHTEGSKKKLLYDNWDKLVKNVPIWSLCTDLPTDNESIRTLVDNHYVAGTGHPSRRNELWGKLHAMAKAPVKLFGCYDDESCPPEDTALLYYRMLLNAAQVVECRLYPKTDYTYPGHATGGHHYDTLNPYFRQNITTRYGEVMTNVPSVYIEMLQFWRRYEQEQ